MTLRIAISILALALASTTPALAQSALPAATDDVTSESGSPRFIVSVTSALDAEIEYADFLDLAELQRQVVDRLARHNIESEPLLSTRALQATPRTYRLHISIDSVRDARRPGWLNPKHDYRIIATDLSLVVTHIAGGEATAAHLTQYDEKKWGEHSDQWAVTNALLMDAVEDVVDRFVSEASSGAFGAQLSRLRVSHRAVVWRVITSRAVIWGVAGFAILILLGVLVCATNYEDRRAAWDTRINKAEAIFIETKGYLPEWYESAAAARCEQILKKDADVRLAEAKRRGRARELKTEYEEIADYAAREHGRRRAEIVEKLRKADEHDFVLLKHAIRIKEEEV